MINLTAGDTRWTGRGSTQRFVSEEAFDTEDEAMANYRKHKAMMRFAGSAGMYFTFPVRVENYVPTPTFDKHCECCGEGIEPENDSYTEIHGYDYCSKSCLTSSQSSDDGDDGTFDDEPYYDDY